MTYLELVNQARANGVSSEKKMWASIEALSNDLAPIKAAHPHVYWNIMRNQHAILYDRHYSEHFANHDVNHLVWSKQPDGVQMPTSGHSPHWTRAEIISATNGMKFHPKVNDWDKYVAFNSMYADLCSEMSDEEILKVAYLFYFCDEDWQPDEDDCTKIWDYTSAHAINAKKP